jgi:hypothetical protein
LVCPSECPGSLCEALCTAAYVFMIVTPSTPGKVYDPDHSRRGRVGKRYGAEAASRMTDYYDLLRVDTGQLRRGQYECRLNGCCLATFVHIVAVGARP